ncbi:TolB-like protein [Flavobacteriaceae bacterium MAR_2010_72]|nr:TolB-like protein [Flavobacteriaceae bacterium MAR_2010_72]
MSSFFEELKRRNVIKAAIAYAVVAWVLLQVLSLILPNVGAPEWVMKTITILAIIGFPIWVFFSWVYEVTPDGLKKTEKVNQDESITETTNKRLNILILVGLVLAIAVSFLNSPNIGASNSKDLIELDNSIAVLYFDDLSSGGDTEWFCDGVTEDILTNLSKFKNLTVTSKTSTKRYKKSNKSIPEIAKELGVSYIVEGSVRRHEGKIIITAQLIDANDKHIWAQNYDDEFKEVFKIQQDVSRKIVDQLKIAISPEEQNELTKLPTNNLEAYNLVLKGRSFVDKLTKEDYAIAINLFKQAIALDPNYADAYAELAYANVLSKYIHRDINLEEGFMSEAKKNIEIALDLNPNSVRANSTKGLILTESEDEKMRLKSEQYFKKALKLNPNDAVSHLEISIFYSLIKKDDQKALHHARRASEINPFSIDCTTNLLNILIKMDLVEEAKTLYENKKSIFTGEMSENMVTFMIEAEATFYLKKGEDVSKSITFFKNAINRNPNNASLNERLAVFYDTFLNDDENYALYFKRAIEIDSTRENLLIGYYNALLENKKFQAAKKFGNSSMYQNFASRSRRLTNQFHYHYHQNQNKEALEILKDSVFNDNYYYRLLVYSQIDNKNKVYEIMKANKINNTQKAYAFANLKNRDSLYFYLSKDDIAASNVNSRREFDPYRKEPRYIAFMKKNHLPIIEKYNGKVE